MHINAKPRTKTAFSIRLPVAAHLVLYSVLLSLFGCGSSTSVSPIDNSINAAVETESVSEQPITTTTVVTEQAPSPTEEQGQYDESGIALSDTDLSLLLRSDFEFENMAIQPQSNWVCSQNNTVLGLYFMPANTLDASRPVLVERQLSDSQSEDKLFFWQTIDSDAIALTSTTLSANNTLLSTGSQFDFTTIRFEIIQGEQFFKANSNLYGELLCLYRESR